MAFALALELPLAQMQEMIGKTGFTLSHSSKFDIIVEYFVERGNYNVYEINEALFAFDQSLIETLANTATAGQQGRDFGRTSI